MKNTVALILIMFVLASITSSPYSVQTIRAATAVVADKSLQLGGVAANQFVRTNDSHLSDDRMPNAGSANYVQNISVIEP